MSVQLIGSGGLFTILGKLGKFAHDLQSFQSATYITDFDDAVAAFDGTSFRDVVALFSSQKFNFIAGVNNASYMIQAVATDLVNRMVYDDTPLASKSNIYLSLVELIRQMKASSDSVNDCTVSASSAAISTPTFTGDGILVLSTKRGDGLIQQNVFAEVCPLTCAYDSQTGGVTAGSERFQFLGDQSGGVWDYNWPLGSGAFAIITAANAELDNSSTNLLYNGDFESFTSNLPDGFVAVAGVAGTDFQRSATPYAGTYSLQFIGGGTAPNLTQLFDQTSTTLGSTQELEPQTQYALNFWLKADVVPAAGVLTIDLIDGSNVVIADDQATNNTYSITLSGITTSFVAKNTTFRLPRVLPSTIRLRVRLSTGMSAGSSIFIDHMCLTEMTPLYAGGPSVAIFSGATAFIQPDGWELTFTNDRAGATYGATFQTLFDRWFNMRQLGLMLPYATGGSETISDTLLS